MVEESGGEGPEDTGDVVAVELPTLTACPGADFVRSEGWYPANPWWYLRSTEADMWGTWAALERAAAATGCPSQATEGGVTTFSGDCSAADVEFSGMWETGVPGGSNGLEYVVQDMTAKVALGDHPQDLSASGTFYWDRTVSDGRTVAFVDRAEGHRSIHRGDDLDGEFTFEGLNVVQDTEQFVASGAVTVDWAYGAGRYCPLVDLHAVPDCPEEPDGYYAVQGAVTWLMVANGSDACDGCVDVYTDGVWQELFCELPQLLK